MTTQARRSGTGEPYRRMWAAVGRLLTILAYAGAFGLSAAWVYDLPTLACLVSAALGAHFGDWLGETAFPREPAP